MPDEQPRAGASRRLAIDLRTDEITQPTEEMWRAVRKADSGWAKMGENASVHELEAFAAELAGKEAAMYIPTGSMANLVALMSHTERGDQIILEASSHILWSEQLSLGYVCGVVPRAVEGDRGHIDPYLLQISLAERKFSYRPHTSLICLENTHNAAGGAAISAIAISEVVSVAREHNVAVHMDGARIFNACMALQVDLRELVAGVDSLMISLGKGLSAPGGNLLVGGKSFLQQSRVNLRRLGGHSTKAGPYAAAGLIALKTMVPQLLEDNLRARLLASQLASVEGISVDLDAVQTNIVMVTIERSDMSAHTVADQLAACGIGSYPYLFNVLRLVTHRHITDQDVEQVVREIADILQS